MDNKKKKSLATRAVRRAARRVRAIFYYLRTGYYFDGERVCPDFPNENFENHFKVYRFMRQFATGKDTLDVGCGCGYGTAHLGEVASSVVGIDIDESAIKWAQRRYPGVDYRVMDAQSLAFPNESFDLIVSTENFEHLPDQRRHLAELRRVLRPDGLCFVATPNPECSESFNRYHTHEFTFCELREVFGKEFADVTIVETLNPPANEASRRAQAERIARGDVGVTSLPQYDCTWRSNTHSFWVFAKRPVGAETRNSAALVADKN